MPQKGYPIGTQVWLRDNYPEMGPRECARILGEPYTEKGVRNWAWRHDVKWVRKGKPRQHDQSAVMKKAWAGGKIVPPTEGEQKRRGAVRSAKLASGEIKHPKGMLGKKQTEKCKAASRAQSLALLAKGEHPFQRPKTEAQRQAKSVMMRERLKTPGGVYSRAKRGYRDDMPGIFFRSRWEANYARFLTFLVKNGSVARWEFEPDTFWFEAIRRGVRSYCPDFKVWSSDGSFQYHEVKGWMDKKSATKLKRMKKYHPDVTVLLIGEKAYREVEKKLSGVIPGWEHEK